MFSNFVVYMHTYIRMYVLILSTHIHIRAYIQTYVRRYLVTGDSIGDVKFYDSELKLINW